jgi:hypothetical protein
MSSTARVLNTVFGPYRTEAAIRRAEFADFIPVSTTNTNINAVHPVPVDWLRDELLPRERDDVREHVATLLSDPRGLSASFVEALNQTLINLDAVRGGNGSRPLSISNTRSSGSQNPHSVRFTGIDDITRGVESMTAGPARGSRMVAPESASSRPHGPPRNLSRSATMGATPTSFVPRQPSPNRDALVAIEVHLNEIEGQIDRSTDGSAVRNAIISARSHIARARTFRDLTQDDVELARSLVDSVASIARSSFTPSRPTRNDLLSPRGRGHRRSAPMTLYNRLARDVEREEQHRALARLSRRLPLFLSEPVEPQVGDGWLLPDHSVLRLTARGLWLLYPRPYIPEDNFYLVEED